MPEYIHVDARLRNCCSKIDLEFYPHYMGIKEIKKIHLQQCQCNNTENTENTDYDENTENSDNGDNDIVHHPSELTSHERDPIANGILILLHDPTLQFNQYREWITIPFNEIENHSTGIAAFPWFWSWYYFNDITLLHPLHIQDPDFNLDVHIMIAKRKKI
jgi:hypothetical protein